MTTQEKHQADSSKKPSSSGGAAPVSNPFLAMTASSPTADASKGTKGDMLDLFASEESAAVVSKSPAEDLFSLASGPTAATGDAASSNPFADILSSMGPVSVAGQTNAGAVTGGNAFATSDNFAAAFGSSSTSNIGNVPFFSSFHLLFAFSFWLLFITITTLLSIWILTFVA